MRGGNWAKGQAVIQVQGKQLFNAVTRKRQVTVFCRNGDEGVITANIVVRINSWDTYKVLTIDA